jgi:branched-chain amino acid aminotransferase
MSAHPTHVWFDGAIVPWADARVHVSTATVLRGANVFEGIRAYWNADERELYIFRNTEHLTRLWNSAKIMRMKVPWTAEQLTQAEIDVLRANAFTGTVWFRLSLYFGEEERTGAAETATVGGFILPRLSPRGKGVTDGVDSCISTWTRITDVSMPPRVKAGANYHNSGFAWMEAYQAGYSGQPIMLNERGKVSEGPGACVVLVRGGRLVTPPVTANILESITRTTVLELARDAGIPAEEREVDRTELYIADEAFFCGSGAEIIPINSVDHYSVGTGRPGPITRRLQSVYFSVVEGRLARYRDWLTPVYQTAGRRPPERAAPKAAPRSV